MISLSFVLVLVLGSLAGWIAVKVTGHSNKGLAAYMAIGVVGAALATHMFPNLFASGHLVLLFAGSLFFSIVLLMTIRVFRKYRLQRRRRARLPVEA